MVVIVLSVGLIPWQCKAELSMAALSAEGDAAEPRKW